MTKTRVGVLAVIALALPAVRAHAVVFRVGPDGSYATVQAALTAAATFPFSPFLPPYHEVRIQEGTYRENLRAPSPCCGGRTIKVSGGWNSAFTGKLISPRRTEINGGRVARVLNVPWLTSGSLTFENLTFRDGFVRAGGAYGVGEGAGLRASVGGGQLTLQWIHLVFNVVRADLGGSAEGMGGGALVLVEGGGVLIEQTHFEDNALVQTGGTGTSLAARGGGLNLQISGGTTTIRNTTFLRNFAGGSVTIGGGLYALVQGATGTALQLEDSSFIGNQVPLEAEGTGISISAADGNGTPMAILRRLRFITQSSGRTQLHVSALRDARVDVSDTLVANGRGGVRAFVNDGTAHFTNLTIAHNQRRGFDGQSLGGRLSVFNTIAYGNDGGELALTGDAVTSGFNLIGIDPFFLDPEAGFFGLGGASAAIDAGTNSPPGGLGPRDLARQPRVYNGTVDIGAFEWRP